MTKKIFNFIPLVLILCMIFSSSVFAEETNAIRDMTYEEWLTEQANITEADSAIESDLEPVIISTQSQGSEMVQTPQLYSTVNPAGRLLSDILAEKGNYELGVEINDEFIEKNFADNIISDGGIERTAPTANLIPVIYNEDSLLNGEITTDTIIVFIYNDTDEDGDAIVGRYVDGNAADYIVGGTEDGFIMQVTQPGSYQLIYQVEDSAGEFSRLIRFAFNVVEAPAPEKYQVFEGSFSSADDSITYNFSIDFTDINSAAVCLVRKGYVGARIKVYDESGNQILAKATGDRQAKNWGFIDKPSSDAAACNYTVVVTPYSYQNRASDYRIIIGDKKDTELMMSGIENTVLLDQYYEAKGNLENSAYVPNVGEYWYKYKRESTSVITILSDVDDIRFRILDADLNVGFDSAAVSDTHKTSFLGGSSGITAWKAAEKARLTTVVSQEYYLVIYSTNPNDGISLRTGSMATAVGHPVMSGSNTRIDPDRSIVLNSSSYSSTISFNVDKSALPNTGQVREVMLTGDIRLSYLDRWKVCAPNFSSWNTSPSLGFTIDMGYKVDSSNNALLKGRWDAAIMANSSGNKQTVTPSFGFYYNYEYGD